MHSRIRASDHCRGVLGNRAQDGCANALTDRARWPIARWPASLKSQILCVCLARLPRWAQRILRWHARHAYACASSRRAPASGRVVQAHSAHVFPAPPPRQVSYLHIIPPRHPALASLSLPLTRSSITIQEESQSLSHLRAVSQVNRQLPSPERRPASIDGVPIHIRQSPG